MVIQANHPRLINCAVVQLGLILCVILSALEIGYGLLRQIAL